MIFLKRLVFCSLVAVGVGLLEGQMATQPTVAEDYVTALAILLLSWRVIHG